MRITYDREADALYISFKQTTVTTEVLGDGIAVDYDSDGLMAGIEILDILKRVGEPKALKSVVLEDITADRSKLGPPQRNSPA